MWDNGGQMIFSPEPDYEDLILQRQEEMEIAEDSDDYCASAPDLRCPYESCDVTMCPYVKDLLEY